MCISAPCKYIFKAMYAVNSPIFNTCHDTTHGGEVLKVGKNLLLLSIIVSIVSRSVANRQRYNSSLVKNGLSSKRLKNI
jgi:hypothetical protein